MKDLATLQAVENSKRCTHSHTFAILVPSSEGKPGSYKLSGQFMEVNNH